MKTLDINKPIRGSLKYLSLALAVAAGLVASSAQALTTTATYNLGPQDAGTSINNQSILPTPWIAAGTLPAGSILRSVSINARIDVEGGNDTWANDIFVYVDPGAPPSGSGVLQVGGYDVAGTTNTYITWGNGHTGTLGTTCVDTKNAPANFPNTIDLNGAGLYIGSRGYIPASWSGSITVEYDVPQLAEILTFGPGAVIDQGLKTIDWTVPYGTDVTTLAPTFTLSSGSCDKTSGGTYDFTSPVTYTVTDGGPGNVYTVTVSVTPASSNKDILAFGPAAVISGTDITWTVPLGTDVTTLAPTYTVSSFATGSPVSGTTRNFTSPQTYTITAQDLTFQDYTVTVVESPWTSSPWTGDADSGITSASPYTVAVNCAGAATTVNGVAFQASATSGANFSIGGGVANWGPGGSPNITGGSLTLAQSFIYDGNPRTVTLTNLTPGETYETSLFSFGWEASGRSQTFASGIDSIVLDQDLYGNQNGIRIAYTFVADAASKVLTITPGGGGSFHMCALANRQVSVVAPEAKITSFGPGATLGPVVGGLGDILWVVPVGSNLAALSPSFTMSFGATCLPVSGSTQDFTSPVHYIVKASDFATSGTTTDYTVTVRLANDLVWNVAGGGNWDFATSNWLPSSGPATTFANNDKVTFNNPAGGTITIPSAVTPGTTTIGAAAGNYTFSGAALGGTGSLTMSGSGILTLSSPNTYSGATVVNAGTLQASGNGAIGGSTSFTVADGATLLLTGTGPWPANAATLAGAGAVTVQASGQLNVGFKFDMSAFTGNLNLNGGQFTVSPAASSGFVSPVNGTINVGSGTCLYLGWTGYALNSTVRLNSSTDNGEGLGVLRASNGTLNGSLILGANTTIGADSILNINAVISDGGNGFGFTQVANGTVTLTAVNTYTGNTTVNSPNTLSLADDAQLKFVLGATSGVSNSISGAGTAVLDGNFLIDTTAANALTSGTWMLENVPSLTGMYGSTFTVVGYTADINDDTWTKTASGKTWTFVESTGILTLTSGSDYGTWASAYLPTDVSDPAADSDGDGMTNQEEYAFGLNPTLGSSVSPITAQLDPVTGNFQYTRRATPAATGLTYTVLTSTNLMAWASGGATETGFTTAGDIETVTVNVTAPALDGKLFVRVKAASAP